MRVSTHFKNFNEWKEAAKREGYTVRKIYDDVYHAYDKYGVQGEWGEAKDFGVIWTYTKSNPKKRKTNKELKLFKYNKNTGIWDYVRSVTKENANQWLSVFSKDEPSETFKLSKYPPKMRIKSNPDKKEISGYYLMSGYGKSAQSVGWYKTKEEAEKVATQLNYRGGTHYFVEPSYKRNPVKKFGSRAKFKHKRLVSPKKFAKKSIRTIKRGRKRIIVGCPKGKYDVRRKICRVGTRAQAVLTPKKNPLPKYLRSTKLKDYLQYIKFTLIPDYEMAKSGYAEDFETIHYLLVNDRPKEEASKFVSYLRNQLIPDTKDIAKFSTAKDLQTGANFIVKKYGTKYKRNPKETLYFIHAKSKKGMGLNNGLYNEDRNSLTDKKEDATHFHDKNSANIIKRNLELQYKNWIWKVVPITFFEA